MKQASLHKAVAAQKPRPETFFISRVSIHLHCQANFRLCLSLRQICPSSMSGCLPTCERRFSPSAGATHESRIQHVDTRFRDKGCESKPSICRTRPYKTQRKDCQLGIQFNFTCGCRTCYRQEQKLSYRKPRAE